MRLIGLRLLIRRPLPGILDSEGRGDDDDLRQASLFSGLENHPGEPGVEGKPRHDPPPFGQAPGMGGTALLLLLRFDSANLQQDLDSVADTLRCGAVDEREGIDIAQVQGEHPQDHSRQVGAKDLRRCVERPAEVVFLLVEADADPVPDAAAATLALIGAAAGDRPDGKPRRPGAGVVLGDTGESRVNHIPDPGDGDRSFRHVCRDDDLPLRERPEDSLLLRRGEAREEGKNRRLFPGTCR